MRKSSAGTALTAAVLAIGLSACTGSPSPTPGWADATDKTIGQAISSLGTAQVVLEADQHQHVTHAYAVGALTDMVEVADKEFAKYDAVQPPDDQHELAGDVVARLHEAEQLLVEIRREYASGPSAARTADLLDRIEGARAVLDKLTTTVDGATS